MNITGTDEVKRNLRAAEAWNGMDILGEWSGPRKFRGTPPKSDGSSWFILIFSFSPTILFGTEPLLRDSLIFSVLQLHLNFLGVCGSRSAMGFFEQ